MGMFDYVRFLGDAYPECCGAEVRDGQTKSLDSVMGVLTIKEDNQLYASEGYNGYMQDTGVLPWTGLLDFHASCPNCNVYQRWSVAVNEGEVTAISNPRPFLIFSDA